MAKRMKEKMIARAMSSPLSILLDYYLNMNSKN